MLPCFGPTFKRVETGGLEHYSDGKMNKLLFAKVADLGVPVSLLCHHWTMSSLVANIREWCFQMFRMRSSEYFERMCKGRGWPFLNR